MSLVKRGARYFMTKIFSRLNSLREDIFLGFYPPFINLWLKYAEYQDNCAQAASGRTAQVSFLETRLTAGLAKRAARGNFVDARHSATRSPQRSLHL